MSLGQAIWSPLETFLQTPWGMLIVFARTFMLFRIFLN